MRVAWLPVALLGFAVPALAAAGEFKSDAECVVGGKVADRKGRTGTVTSAGSSMCHVALDDGGTASYLFWMLHAAGTATAAPAADLPPGTYKCYALAGSTTNYLFMDIRIDGPSAYADGKGNQGRYRLEPDGRVVFESGPYAGAGAKRLGESKIGLNMDGGSFYNTACNP